MKRWAVPLATFGLLSSIVAPGMAATPITFAQFTDGSPGTLLANNGSGAGWVSSTLGTTAPYHVEFQFNSLSGSTPLTVQATPFDLPINANLSYTASTPAIATGNAYGAPTLGNGAVQDFTQVTLQVTAVGTQVVGGITIPNGANLLSMTAGQFPFPNEVGGALSGTTGAQSATFGGGTSPGGDTIVFKSDYLGGETPPGPGNWGSFNNSGLSPEQTYAGAYGLSYSGVTSLPTSSPNTGFTLTGPTFFQYIAAFEAETTGTFSANLPVVSPTVPEPGALALLFGTGVTGVSLLARRRR